MRPLFILIFFFILTFPIHSFAKKENSSKDHLLFFDLGENEVRDYKGPSQDIYPTKSELHSFAEGRFYEDDVYLKNFVFSSLNKSLINLEQFWLGEFKEGSLCPTYYFKKNYKYLRYLFRLLALSYHYESLKIYHGFDQRLGIKTKDCEINPKTVFGQCLPQGKEMGGFLRRIFSLEKKKKRYSSFKKKTLRKLLKVMAKKEDAKGSLGVIQLSLRSWCKNKKKGICLPPKVLDLKRSIKLSCKKVRNDINKMCSESDSFYGFSNISEMGLLLEFSHVLSLVDQGGHGRQCLRRFIQFYRTKEVKMLGFSKWAPKILEHLRKKKSRYLQGEFFLYGSLKEFENKGLGDFLVASVSKKKKKRVITKKRKRKIKTVQKLKKQVIKKEQKVETPSKLTQFLGSQFKKTTFVLKKTGMPKLPVNMKKFKKDFLFNEDVSLRLKVEFSDLEDFSILQRMKIEQKLGSKDLPLLLLYLKFLIEFKRHGALYNMINILGNKFYVLNDLDDDPTPYLIELKNEQKTNWNWQIYIFNPEIKK
jgi:hypothetical protein